MSDKKNNDQVEAARQEMAQKRLLKANNVQRRRFEMMAEELVEKAKRRLSRDHNDERIMVKKAVIRDIMGEDYDALMALRDRIRSHKRQIEEYKKMGESIRRKLEEKGIDCSRHRAMSYYLDPPIEDEKRDMCNTEIGDPTIQLDLRQCRGNDAFVEYEKRTLHLDEENRDLQYAAENLRASVWQLVTTDEIREELDIFREEFIND